MEAVRSATPAPSRSADPRPAGRRHPFFSAKSHASIWRVLRTALLRAEGVILLTGGEGSGKSTLIKRLPGMIPDNRDLVMIPSADLPDAEFLQQLIAATTLVRGEAGALVPVESTSDAATLHLPLAHAAPALTLQDLIDAMEERVANGRRLVLVVDDAHLIAEEPLAWLDMMVRFVSEGIKPVQLLLSGRPELRSVLDSESGRNLTEQIVGSCEVTPLTRGEVWDYLALQLDKSMGWPIRVSWFAWVEVYGYSQGVPLKIDQLLKRILPLLRQRNAKKVSRAMVRLAMTMGRPMQPGSFIASTPKARAAVWLGGVSLLAGAGYLMAGLFEPTTSDTDKPVIVKKGDSGESSSYVRLPEPTIPKTDKGDKTGKTDKGDKTSPLKESKAPEEKADDKPAAPKKRYWEPNMPIRPDGPLPLPERAEPGLSALSKPASEPILPNRSLPDPESFRKRYQSAKAVTGPGNAPFDPPPPADPP
ncbi:MAG: AAA family ATPase, partial [Magnetococcales bacterium]|nr:AAA family ATPase [Magnetococcales bacterium]